MKSKRHRVFVRLLAIGSILLGGVAGAATPVILFYVDSDPASVLDCTGVADALDELGLPFVTVDLDATPLEPFMLLDRAAAVLCHVPLAPDEAQALGAWVEFGGGVLASGQSGLGLETMLGVTSLDAVAGNAYTEVRFSVDHPVTTGSWWDGPIMHSPPMPAVEIPNIMRYLYFDDTLPGGWPAYAIEPAAASGVGFWRDSMEGWFEPDGAPAVTVHQHGAGRVVYSGALAGAHANWDWPHTWRTFIATSLHWLAVSEPTFEIGLWPHGHRSALTWTGDTEKPAMVTAVPALLDVFAQLGLERFGTFYVVGRAGGDDDTLGALEHPEILQMIAGAGAQVGGHGNIHTAFGGGSLLVQQQRLQEMIDIINPILAPYGEQVRGFRAPYVSQDLNTLQALANVGLDYDAGEIDVWSQTTLPHRLGPVWEIPPTMPMDWHLFIEHGLSAEQAGILFQNKLDYVISRRGLFSWLHHPWVIEPHIELVEELLGAAVARGDIWMTRQDDLLDWWIARQAVEIGEVERQPGRLRLRVDHDGPAALDGVSIWIRLPSLGGSGWHVRLNGSGHQGQQVNHAGQEFLVVVLDGLEPDVSQWLELIRVEGVFLDRFEGIGPP